MREDGEPKSLPSRENLLRHETLAIPAQQDPESLAPTLSRPAHRQFLIGHSLRSRHLRSRQPEDFPRVRWSTWKVHAPLDAPPERLGEDDRIDD